MVRKVKALIKVITKASVNAAAAKAVARTEDRFEVSMKAKKAKKPVTPAQRKADRVKSSRRYRRKSQLYKLTQKKRGLLISNMVRSAEDDTMALKIIKLQAENDALRKYMSLTEHQVRVDQVLERKRQRWYDEMVEMIISTVSRCKHFLRMNIIDREKSDCRHSM